MACVGQNGPSWHRCYCRCTLLKLPLAGNRLWEQWLVNRHGVGGYDARTHESLGDNWPPELGADYRDFTLKFQERTHEVLLKILQALALGLGWEEFFFDEVCDRHKSQSKCVGWHRLETHMTECMWSLFDVQLSAAHFAGSIPFNAVCIW